VSGWAANDTPYFVPLLERTAKYFQVQEVSADKAYLSHKNLQAVAQAHATPFIPFKANTIVPKGNSIWTEMYHYFMYNREEFLAHYHKRSNVETAFSMIKAKFGDAVRSKSDIGHSMSWLFLYVISASIDRHFQPTCLEISSYSKG
jgi:transposase